MSRVALTPAQNERVREHVRELLRQHGNNQSLLAPKLGMRQSGVSGFLSGRAGTTYIVVQRVAKLLKVPEWEVLGDPPPRVARAAPRDEAAELAREIGVSEQAIADVLAEPIEGREAWYVLWWADRMRRRDLELLPSPPAASPLPAPAAPAKTKAGGPARKKAT